ALLPVRVHLLAREGGKAGDLLAGRAGRVELQGAGAVAAPDVQVDVAFARGGEERELLRQGLDVDAVPTGVVEVPGDGELGGVVGAHVDVESSRLPGKRPAQPDVFTILRVRSPNHPRLPVPRIRRD